MIHSVIVGRNDLLGLLGIVITGRAFSCSVRGIYERHFFSFTLVMPDSCRSLIPSKHFLSSYYRLPIMNLALFCTSE